MTQDGAFIELRSWRNFTRSKSSASLWGNFGNGKTKKPPSVPTTTANAFTKFSHLTLGVNAKTVEAMGLFRMQSTWQFARTYSK